MDSLHRAARKFSNYFRGCHDFHFNPHDKFRFTTEQSALKSDETPKAFDAAAGKFNESDYAKRAGITADFYNQRELILADAEQPAAFEEIVELETRQLKFRHNNGLKFKVEDTLASLDAAFMNFIEQKSEALFQQIASAKEKLQADVVRMTGNLLHLKPTDMLTQAKANIYADLLDTAKHAIDFLDNKFFTRAFAMTAGNPSCADLHAGIITAADLKHDDVPDFCNGETFNPDDFLRQDYELIDFYTARLSQNISKLKIAIAALTAAGQRATEMTDCLVSAEAVLYKRLEFP